MRTLCELDISRLIFSFASFFLWYYFSPTIYFGFLYSLSLSSARSPSLPSSVELSCMLTCVLSLTPARALALSGSRSPSLSHTHTHSLTLIHTCTHTQTHTHTYANTLQYHIRCCFCGYFAACEERRKQRAQTSPPHRCNFWKVSSIVIMCSTFGRELTFENSCQLSFHGALTRPYSSLVSMSVHVYACVRMFPFIFSVWYVIACVHVCAALLSRDSKGQM